MSPCCRRGMAACLIGEQDRNPRSPDEGRPCQYFLTRFKQPNTRISCKGRPFARSLLSPPLPLPSAPPPFRSPPARPRRRVGGRLLRGVAGAVFCGRPGPRPSLPGPGWRAGARAGPALFGVLWTSSVGRPGVPGVLLHALASPGARWAGAVRGLVGSPRPSRTARRPLGPGSPSSSSCWPWLPLARFGHVARAVRSWPAVC